MPILRPPHPLEHIVFSGLERELTQRHGLRGFALTQEAYLLDLVQTHVYPHHAAELESGAGPQGWETWCREEPRPPRSTRSLVSNG